MNLYVDIHVLQTVPPSCLNRDDTGSPKTALYGGTRRARVSSQAWKSVIRKEFRTMFSEELLGNRTKYVMDVLVKEIKKLLPDESETNLQKKAKQAFKQAGLELGNKKGKEGELDALFFISNAQARKLAELIVENKNDKKSYEDALKDNISIDIALFGRMVAKNTSLKCDAAAQVAHAISTHSVQNEYDYFTAVDDCFPEGGAKYLDTVEYNSATLYRYATINANELKNKLGEMTPTAIKGFLDAFIRTMPTGRQNSFANRTMPDMIYITIRKDQPINFAGAFEKAVVSQNNGYVLASEKALYEYCERMYRDYDMAPEYEFVSGTDIWSELEKCPLPDMLNKVEDIVKNELE